MGNQTTITQYRDQKSVGQFKAQCSLSVRGKVLFPSKILTVIVNDVDASPCTVGWVDASRGCGYNNSGWVSLSCT